MSLGGPGRGARFEWYRLILEAARSIAVSLGGEIEVIQSTHDDLNANVNLQVGDVDVSATNPVPTGIRRVASAEILIANGTALSAVFDMSAFAMGVIHMPAAWTAASIGFQVSTVQAGPFLPLYDDTSAIVEVVTPVVNQSYVFPTYVAPCRWIRLWSQTAGVDVNQLGERRIAFDVKS